MPRPRDGRVGQSTGVAEHQVASHTPIAKHRIAPGSKPTLPTRVMVLACAVTLTIGFVPGAAGALPASGSTAGTRAAIDATANLWFAAQQRAAELDGRIRMLTSTIARDEHRLDAIRRAATSRAVQVYEDSAMGFDTVVGSDTIDLARRSELIGQVNAQGQNTIDRLERSVADMRAKRAQLRAAQSDQNKALRDLAAQRHALDAQLAALRTRESQTAHAALAASIRRVATSGPAAATSSAAPPPPAAPAPLPNPAPPGAPTDPGLVSPHHDAPFLVCTRARESNGDYAAVSPSGYYGAYQFAPTTWDVTASHAGRLDLVGVLPSTASQHDQDEMAWTLYTWQGNGPWGGRC